MGERKREGAKPPAQGGGPGFRRGPGGMGRPIEKPKDFKGAIKKLAGYLGAERRTIIFAAILAAGSTLLGVTVPWVLMGATDEVMYGIARFYAGTGGIDLDAIRRIAFIILALISANMFLDFLQGYVMVGVSLRITFKLREQISEKIHRLPLKYFDRNTHGDVLSRITNDVDTISGTLGQGLVSALQSTIAVLGIVTMMLIINVPMTLAAMIVLPLSFVIVRAIIKRSQKYFKAQQENLGKLNGHIEEMFTNHVIVKSFNGEESSVRKFDEHNQALYGASWRATFLSGLMMPIVGFISNIGYVVIVVLAASWWWAAACPWAAYRRSSSTCAGSACPCPTWPT